MPSPAVNTLSSPALEISRLPRPAWVEVDLSRFKNNWRRIRTDLPNSVAILYVVKDNAYGMGAANAARIALANGATFLGAYTLDEAHELRRAGIQAPLLLLGERTPEELPICADLEVIPCIGSLETAQAWACVAQQRSRRLDAHIKINTGMNRFGFPWREVESWAPNLAALPAVNYAGALGHFAQSDEADKTFAREQLQNFGRAIRGLNAAGIAPPILHHCNSGGFLDLPEAHFDMVRIGILALGIYPSAVCRRIEGILPVLSVKTRIVALQRLQPGDTVGYGMRFRAETPRVIAVLPVGYGDGFPRVRNEGHALIRGQRVPIVGGVSMDALTVDVTDLSDAQCGEEAVLMGQQGAEVITPQDLAQLKRSVSYDILVSLRNRLPRISTNG